MTDKPTPTDAEILDAAEDFRSQYTHGGTTFDEFDEIGFARAVLAKWGQPAGATEEVENLRKALVYAAFALHGTPQYMLAQGITLIDGDTVRVSRDGWTVEASVNPHRQPAPATQQAVAADEAPLSSLPSWEECQLRVSNSDFLAKRVAEGGYGAESDSKVATELHRFLYEYDDQDPYRSAWFRHRLEKVLTECASHGQAPAGAAEEIDKALNVYAQAFAARVNGWTRQNGDDLPGARSALFAAIHAYARASTQPSPTAQAASVQEDAALWHWLAEYLVGPRTDLDDEIVASETVNDLRKLVKAAIKQGEKQ